MQKIEKINYFDLIEVNKKINNPFSREIFISTIKKEYGNVLGRKEFSHRVHSHLAS